jgi:hypothetical protein
MVAMICNGNVGGGGGVELLGPQVIKLTSSCQHHWPYRDIPAGNEYDPLYRIYCQWLERETVTGRPMNQPDQFQ